MPHIQRLAAIRDLVRSAFAELGAPTDAELSEHLLIRNDLYCGRRFRCGSLQAVWFIEEDQIKIFGRDNALVRVLAGSAVAADRAARPQRQAA